MSEKQPVNDVVVLLPGILGSVLQREGKDVWAMSRGALWRGLVTLGRSVKDLELDGDDPSKPDLGDGVTAARLMPDLHLIPGFWKIDGYGKIKHHLFEEFEFTDGLNWFDFPYDWRRDNRAAAHRLAEAAPRWLEEYRKVPGKEQAKLVLLGHSMGGLVARYFLEALGGWEMTRALITFGTPYRGSMNAIDFLAHGFRKGFGPFKIDLSNLLRSLTSVHQLLPTYPCVDDGSGSLRRVSEASALPDGFVADRLVAAKAFHDEIAAAVDRNGGYGRYQIFPVSGIFQPTRQSAVVRDGTVEILKELDGRDLGGDGTVPRVSATPIELSDAAREIYATEAHASLQNFDPVLVQVRGVLTWESLALYKATPADGFRLEVDDVVPPGEPVDVVLATGGPVLNVEAAVVDVDTGATFTAGGQLGSDGRASLSLPPLPAGVYRIEGRETDGVGLKPVHDVLVVADDATAEAVAEQDTPTVVARTRGSAADEGLEPVEPPEEHDCEDAPEGVIPKGDSAAERGWGPGWPTDNSSKMRVVRAGGIAVSVRAELAPLITWLLEETVRRGYGLRHGECWGFCNRPIRGTSRPSNHSWGLAVDLNAPANPMTDRLVTDMPGWMPELWKSRHFRWGGDYTTRKDAMHYEFMGNPADAARLAAEVGHAAAGGTTTRPGAGGGRPLLERQARGDAVRRLQTRLNAHGSRLEVDGVFGKATEEAVRAFQAAKGLEVDGKVGRNTWAALGKSPPQAAGGGSPLLERQARGDAVRRLQARLNAHGSRLEVDGVFGKATEEAVRAFQAAKGLEVDGKVGKNTWAALG